VRVQSSATDTANSDGRTNADAKRGLLTETHWLVIGVMRYTLVGLFIIVLVLVGMPLTVQAQAVDVCSVARYLRKIFQDSYDGSFAQGYT